MGENTRPQWRLYLKELSWRKGDFYNDYTIVFLKNTIKYLLIMNSFEYWNWWDLTSFHKFLFEYHIWTCSFWGERTEASTIYDLYLYISKHTHFSICYFPQWILPCIEPLVGCQAVIKHAYINILEGSPTSLDHHPGEIKSEVLMITWAYQDSYLPQSKTLSN